MENVDGEAILFMLDIDRETRHPMNNIDFNVVALVGTYVLLYFSIPPRAYLSRTQICLYLLQVIKTKYLYPNGFGFRFSRNSGPLRCGLLHSASEVEEFGRQAKKRT